jgi:hypothetical protein
MMVNSRTRRNALMPSRWIFCSLSIRPTARGNNRKIFGQEGFRLVTTPAAAHATKTGSGEKHSQQWEHITSSEAKSTTTGKGQECRAARQEEPHPKQTLPKPEQTGKARTVVRELRQRRQLNHGVPAKQSKRVLGSRTASRLKAQTGYAQQAQRQTVAHNDARYQSNPDQGNSSVDSEQRWGAVGKRAKEADRSSEAGICMPNRTTRELGNLHSRPPVAHEDAAQVEEGLALLQQQRREVRDVCAPTTRQSGDGTTK